VVKAREIVLRERGMEMQQDRDDQASEHSPVSDTSIRDDVLLELRSDPKIGAETDIAVAATNGVVTLDQFRAFGRRTEQRRES
jgi:osmotically-inducible protein OsmY